jgi:hypothetical protein
MNDTASHRRPRAGVSPSRAVGWLSAALLVVAAGFGPAALPAAAATTLTPIDSGNPSCAAFAPAGETWLELRLADHRGEGPAGLNELQDGTYTNGVLTVTLANYVESSSGTPGSFDWSANIGVDAVFVKAGSQRHNLYTFEPEAMSGADVRPQAGNGNGISHLSFCYDVSGVSVPSGDPSLAPSVAPSGDPSLAPSVAPSGDPSLAPSVAPSGDPSLASADPSVSPADPDGQPEEADEDDGDVDPDPAGGTSSATGEVLAAIGRPSLTLPPTDTLVGASPVAGTDIWRLALVAIAAVIVALLLLPSRRATVRG